jgi:glycolate oxidase FAD binding subunit
MTAVLAPHGVTELVDIVRSTPQLIAVGGRTKPRLSTVGVQYPPLDMRGIRGIVEYDPAEYTMTALAGTSLKELSAALAEHRQYIPFDPPLVNGGATLGGAVAADCSGPGRFRFGGVRDFVLGVRFVDGRGRLLRVGGKVVKNAAGFDVPKFFVGSMGRFGVMAEVTLKVLPRPESTLTLRLRTTSLDEAWACLVRLGKSRFQPDALDIEPGTREVMVRLAGPAPALSALARQVLTQYSGEVLAPTAAEGLWSSLLEMHWVPEGGVLARCTLTLTSGPAVLSTLATTSGAMAHVTGGGNLAYVWMSDLESLHCLHSELKRHQCAGVVLRGEGPLLVGYQHTTEIAKAVKHAFDPDARFPDFDLRFSST